jgi:hypothetical protein
MGRLGIHATGAAARAELTDLAGESEELLAAAVGAVDAGEAVRRISAARKGGELSLHEGTDSAAVSSAEHTMTSTSPGTLDSWEPTGGTWTGALELVRFKVVVQSSSGLGFVAARMLSPSWVTN